MLWIKSLHIIFAVAWFAGLFYLPRLFVHHAECDDAAGPRAIRRDGAASLPEHYAAGDGGDFALRGGAAILRIWGGMARREDSAGDDTGCLSFNMRQIRARFSARTKPPLRLFLPLVERSPDSAVNRHCNLGGGQAVLTLTRVGISLRGIKIAESESNGQRTRR